MKMTFAVMRKGKSMDLIERQAAIEVADAIWTVTGDKNVANVWQQLKDLPSAQPEQKKGEWIPVDSFSAFGGDESMWMAHGNPVAFYYCSNCKEQAYTGEDGQSLITDFCPFCGADLRGEQE